MAVSYVDRQTLAVLAPTVTAALQISDATYGWLASTLSLAYLIATPLAGRWVDAVGARRGLLVAVITWSLVAASHALVTGASALFVTRIALGIAEPPSFMQRHYGFRARRRRAAAHVDPTDERVTGAALTASLCASSPR